MRPDIFLATIGRGSNGSNALEVTEDRAAVTAESQDNIINRVNNVSQYGPSWHYVPGIGVAGTAYAEVPGSALGDLAFTRASSKTRTNAAGVVETIAANVPPHDYRNADGTLSTFPRLNLEPQRTNSIRNSSMVGAVAGTPGTLPTNWVETLGGLTRSIVAVGTESGLPYVDFRFSGTASTNLLRVQVETVNAIPATNGQTWSESLYLKSISGTIPQLNARITLRDAATSLLGSLTSSAITATSTLSRYTFTGTLANASVAFVQPEIQIILVNGQTYDFTIRIAAPQMELGAYATTWVPTTTAAVTRLADTASKTGVSSLIGQTEGTLFVEANLANFVTNAGILTVSDGTNNNIISITTFSSNRIRVLVRTGGSGQFALNSNTYAAGNFKIAVVYKASDFAFYINGVQVALQLIGTVPSCPNIYVGITGDGTTNPLSDRITQAALLPTRLTNAQLAQLTTL